MESNQNTEKINPGMGAKKGGDIQLRILLRTVDGIGERLSISWVRLPGNWSRKKRRKFTCDSIKMQKEDHDIWQNVRRDEGVDAMDSHFKNAEGLSNCEA